MAVVKYTPIPWQMDDFDSIKAHIKQFHEKLQEVGLLYIPGEEPIDFETLTQPTLPTAYSNTFPTYDICGTVYKMPKGTGEVNFSEPDSDGAVSVVSTSPILNTDLFLLFTWRYFKSTPDPQTSNGNRGYSLEVNVSVSRQSDFLSANPTLDFVGSFKYYMDGRSNAINGTITILNDSVMTLSREGLTILHGMHKKDVGNLYTSGSPRSLCQMCLTIESDQTVNVFRPFTYYTSSTTSTNGTLSQARKSGYDYSRLTNNNTAQHWTRPRIAEFPFDNISVRVNNQPRGLNCYGLDSQNNITVNDNVYGFMRGNPNGDNEFYCYYRGRLVKRVIYFEEHNSMTPNAWTSLDTFIEYNREYGHIIEYAPLINTTY